MKAEYIQLLDKILEEINFDQSGFQRTQMGLRKYLYSIGIKILLTPVDGGWQYCGADMKTEDVFTQDLTIYPTSDECRDAAIVECFAYYSLKLKHK